MPCVFLLISVISMPDILIENIVAQTHLDESIDLEKVVERVPNAVMNEELGAVIYRFRDKGVIQIIHQNGKIISTGARSLEDIEFTFASIYQMMLESEVLLSPEVEEEGVEEGMIQEGEEGEGGEEPPEQGAQEEGAPAEEGTE